MATVLPVNSKHDSFFGKVPPTVALSVLQGMCVGTKRRTDADPTAVNITDRVMVPFVPAHAAHVAFDKADEVRHFQFQLYDAIEAHPDAHAFYIERPDARQYWSMCFAGLISVHVGLGRMVCMEIVDPLCPYVKGFQRTKAWRCYLKQLQEQNDGVSALMVMGHANNLKTISSTYNP